MAGEAPAAGAGGELFTRGGMDAPDARGPSMVAIHADKMQKEKEARAMDALRTSLPNLTAATHAVALQESGGDADAAAALLRAFAAARTDDLRRLQKERKRHQKKLAEWAAKEAGGGSGSDDSASASGSDSGSDSSSSGSSASEGSDDDRGGRRSGRKRSHPSKSDRRGSKKRRKEKKERKDSKKRRREKDRDKKRRRDKGKDKDRKRDKDRPGKKEFEYGRYGVIRETDYYAKRPEFTLWALEEKKADVEAMSRFEEKELFKTFMEDYNTATLPHRKYYDLEAYDKAVAARGGGDGGSGGERTVFDDEAERRREAAAARERDQADRLRAAYEELRTTDKAAAMREQELLRAKMALAYRTGDQKEAARIAERLKPDDKP